jgi:hypothetical protein
MPRVPGRGPAAGRALQHEPELGVRWDKAWFLESVAADGTHLSRPIHRLPFGIGRDPANDLALETFGLSRQHARHRFAAPTAA